MKQLRILNGHACIGGNRKLWGSNHKVTAVELDPKMAEIYQDNYPEDTVIVGDVNDYVLKHHNEFDFIWLSPPCPTHSRINTDGQQKPRFPDMALWQLIIFLSNNWYKGKWSVENVIPYYKGILNSQNMMILPSVQLGRHLFWTNFKVPNRKFKSEKPISEQKGTGTRYGFSLEGRKGINKKKTLRNIVDPEIGKYILDCAYGVIQQESTEQTALNF